MFDLANLVVILRAGFGGILIYTDLNTADIVRWRNKQSGGFFWSRPWSSNRPSRWNKQSGLKRRKLHHAPSCPPRNSLSTRSRVHIQWISLALQSGSLDNPRPNIDEDTILAI
jgi:hypothetical protein